MMKKKIVKLLSMGISAMLVFSLAGCGGEKAAEESGSDLSPSEPVIQEAESVSNEEISESQTDSAPETGRETPGNGQGMEITDPGSDIAKAVALYNSAIVKSGFTQADIQRMWGGSSAGKFGDLNTLSGGAVQKLFEEPATVNVTPGPIRAEDIASVASENKGNTIILTIQVKDVVKAAASEMKHGSYSYPYFISFSEADQLVQEIAKEVSKGMLKILLNEAETTITLTKGVMEAVIDKTSGKIISLSGELDEEIVSNADVKPLVGETLTTIYGKGRAVFK